jgi:hypothetical protein
MGSRESGDSSGLSYRIHRLSARLGEAVVLEIIRRYEAGDSATALAKEHDASPSALLNLMRSRKVVIRERGVSDELAAKMAAEYEAGATVAELEEVHDLSHNAVLRALKSKSVLMRSKGRRAGNHNM